MLRSLLQDLLAVPGVEVLTTRDARLPALSLPVETMQIMPDGEVWDCWQRCMDAVDAVWLIAPETEGVLERLSRMVQASGRVLLGSSPEAVAIAARKSATSVALTTAGINVAPVYTMPDIDFTRTGVWVVKPDDGAGCDDTVCFSEAGTLRAWLAADPRRARYVAQPFLPGIAASLSMLCRDGRARLLSCNRQLIEMNRDVFSYRGSLLNGMSSHWEAFDGLARDIARALPGLAGYVGVDVMVAEDRVTVLEINPRLTTSYVGMRRATGQNPAGLVLDMFYNDAFEWPGAMARHPVEISLDEF